MSHTADAGIVAYGTSLDELFANAAYGMFDLMFDVDRLEPDTSVGVVVEADGVEGLLVAWLSDLLGRFEIENRVWCRFTPEVRPGWRVAADVEGAPVGELRGAPVKAVTYHGIEIRRDAAGWRATVYFDV